MAHIQSLNFETPSFWNLNYKSRQNTKEAVKRTRKKVTTLEKDTFSFRETTEARYHVELQRLALC